MKYIGLYILLFVLCLFSCNKNKKVEKEYLSETIISADESNLLEENYLKLANLYNDINNSDSALYFLNKSKNIGLEKNVTDSLFYFNLYEAYSLAYENKGDYEKAAFYKHQGQKNRYGSFQDDIKRAVTDIEKKYNRELLLNDNNRLKIRVQYLWISLLIVGIIILIVFFILYYRKQKHEKELLEARQRIYDLKQMAETYSEKVSSTRNILLQHLDVLKKSALLENFLREDEKLKGRKLLQKFNEIVYQNSSFDWNLLYDIINEIHDGFFDRIKIEYSSLDDVEFKICCLIYIGFSNSEISIVLERSVNTIIAKRTSIRKKMEIKEHGNIINFLDENISKK